MTSEQCFFTGGLWTPCQHLLGCVSRTQVLSSISRVFSVSEASAWLPNLHFKQHAVQTVQVHNRGKHGRATLKSLSQKPPERASFLPGPVVQALVTHHHFSLDPYTRELLLLAQHSSKGGLSPWLVGSPLTGYLFCSQGSSLALGKSH